MPIYMDVHNVPGVKAKDVAEAHRRDMLVQDQHECNCITYWIDEDRQNIFCLIEAPTKDAVSQMHGQAHGLIPHKIIEVNKALVGSFLGRLYDPVDAQVTEDGLKVFADSSFRIVQLIHAVDLTLLTHRLGADKASTMFDRFHQIIRDSVSQFEGREVEGKHAGILSSFRSAPKAVSCSIAILKKLSEAKLDIMDVSIALNGGEPVSDSELLFGDTVQLASFMNNLEMKQRIIVAHSVDELIATEVIPDRRRKLLALTPLDESLLLALFGTLESRWTEADFNVASLGDAVAMSTSQLYRKVIALCGMSPVSLLKGFRLGKAKELMRKQRFSISEITFASGFASPSYFTKCFKKKYGLLPMAYVDLLH
jgi:AraC-like DNA-binding protein